MTTAADDRYITMQHLRNRRLSASATGRWHGISAQTVWNRLRQNDDPIRPYRPYFGQILTRRHRAARLDWCRRPRHFRRADWRSVLFSDESRFNLSHADGRERIYRRRGSVTLTRASLRETALGEVQYYSGVELWMVTRPA